MRIRANVIFDSVRKKTNYTYTIKGIVAYRGSEREFTMEYSGTEILVKSGFIHSDIESSLKDELNKEVGYGPFDKSQIAALRNIRIITFSVDGGVVQESKVHHKK